MKYELIPHTDPRLTTPCIPFVFNGEIDAEQLAMDMITFMEENKGIGLSANQIGLPWKVFVVHGDPFACFNPKIVDVSLEEIVLEEGCLSFPGLYVKVKRPKSIRVRYANFKGDVETNKYTGMTARIIMHEMEHLSGKLFYQTANKFHRDQAFRLWKKYQRHPERFVRKEKISLPEGLFQK